MFTERVHMLMTPEQRRRLERLAAERQVSIGALIRDAVEAHTALAGSSRADAVEAPVDDWPVMKVEIQRRTAP